MYSGSAEFNKLIEQAGGNAIKPVFVFSNFNVESFKSLKYYGGANGGDNIDIGTTDSAYLEVTAYTDKVIANQEFLFKAGMELSGGTIEYAPMGVAPRERRMSRNTSIKYEQISDKRSHLARDL